MCGIVGIHGRPEPGLGERMLDRLVHRGPDDAGKLELDHSWLGHRRLSIVDVDGGGQPLSTPSGATHLVGNGEVYNHGDVRRTLPDEALLTRSDNEVALAVVEARGPEAFAELLGMFAFVAAGEDGSFVAARDPVGIKPLYWAERDGQMVFASEMAAYDEDWQAEVRVVPPGHYWTAETGFCRFRRAVPKAPLGAISGPDEAGAPVPEAILRMVRERLVTTVERQMMGDVPVGVFLSGGLDSSLVAGIAARYLRRRGERLKTFAVGLEGSADLLAAREVAEYLETDHTERIYTAEEAIEKLPDVVRAIESYDPTLVHSAVPNYLLAETAAQHVKVVLTGEGADELFAGYEHLEEFETEDELHAELVRMIEGLHNLNLQRADRVTMAHGLEGRVPFLELDMIELGLALPAAWKLANAGQAEKRVLREAFAGWLPDRILWRTKAQFGEGSGASSVLRKRMEDSVDQAEFELESDSVRPPLRTPEELAYYRLFAEHLPGVKPGHTLGRFALA